MLKEGASIGRRGHLGEGAAGPENIVILTCKVNSEEENRVRRIAALRAHQLACHINSIFQDFVLDIVRPSSTMGPKLYCVRAFVCTAKVNMCSGDATAASDAGEHPRKRIIST
jgi:hypothetical protein